jgi:hypothetical protein
VVKLCSTRIDDSFLVQELREVLIVVEDLFGLRERHMRFASGRSATKSDNSSTYLMIISS